MNLPCDCGQAADEKLGATLPKAPFAATHHLRTSFGVVLPRSRSNRPPRSAQRSQHFGCVTCRCRSWVSHLLATMVCLLGACSGYRGDTYPAITPKANFVVLAKSDVQNNLLRPIECSVRLPFSSHLWCCTHGSGYRTSFLEISEKSNVKPEHGQWPFKHCLFNCSTISPALQCFP